MKRWIVVVPGSAIKTGYVDAASRKEALEKLAQGDFLVVDTNVRQTGKPRLLGASREIKEKSDG